MTTLKTILLYCLALNYGLLLVWVALAVFGPDPLYGLTVRLFRIPRTTFDAVNYAGIAAYKTLIIAFNLVPYLALVLAT